MFFLAPYTIVFPKRDIPPAFTSDCLRKARQAGIIDTKVIALGGVTANRLSEIGSLGFGGVALLGDVWQQKGTDFVNHFKVLLRSVSVL